MHTTVTQLEGSSDVDIPPRRWADLLSAAQTVVRRLFPHGTVGLRVVDALMMRRLNSDYRNVDAPTDVLAFPAGADSRGNVGDIALCWDAVERQARANGNSVVAEALALTTHGLLHLAGQGHATRTAQAEMNRRTQRLCGRAGYEVTIFGH